MHLAIATIIVAFAMWPILVRGDAIVVTKAGSASTVAEIFVEDDSVRAELEIGAEDIEAFRNLLPDEIYQKLKLDDPQPFDERIEKFFSNDLVIFGDEKPLSGNVLNLVVRKRIIRDEITGKPLARQSENGPVVIYAELEYELIGKPKTISIQPPRAIDNNFVNANIGFITYHRGLPVMDFRYLSNQETLNLDWDDPWYSQFLNRNLRRQYDAPMSVFLYVEPFEVRVEVIARPVDLQRWFDLGVTIGNVIEVPQQSELKSRVAAFLKDKISLKIDDQPANGRLDRIHFIRRTLRKTGVIYPDEELDASSATLGVIFVYPIEQLPENVKLTWELFDDRIQSVPSVATDEAGGLPWTLTKDDPVLEWKNFLTNPTIPAMLAIEPPPTRPQISLPLVSFGLLFVALAMVRLTKMQANRPTAAFLIGVWVLVILGAIWFWPSSRIQFANPIIAQQKVTNPQATEVTHSLMHNLYHSFDRRDESVIYDQLATCVSGELLREIYIQIMQRVTLEDQGGAQVKIDEIDVLTTETVFREDSPGFKSSVKWNVIGSVGHWGHIHTRANQYVADFGVEPVDGAWKIVSLRITDETSLGSKPVN